MRTEIGRAIHFPVERLADPPVGLSSVTPPQPSRTFNLIRLAVLSSSVALMLPGAWGHSATVVEFAHLPAGLAAWQRGSLGIYRVCGPLSKLLYALPAHLAGFRVDYPKSFDSDVRSRQEWNVGGIFQSQNREHYHDIYRWSRLLPILLTVLGGCLICEWSTRLFGNWPGIGSLCLWSWMSPVLAHGSLVTSDMPSAVLLIVAARSFWAFLREPRVVSACLAGVSLGLGAATKFTLLILYPSWGLLLLLRAAYICSTKSARSNARRTTPTVRAFLSLSALLFLSSALTIDTLYLYHGVGYSPLEYDLDRSSFFQKLRDHGSGWATSWLLKLPWPLPSDFFHGLDLQMADAERVQMGYLLGQSRAGGWWYWYVAAALFKLPLPAIALFAFAMLCCPTAIRRNDATFWASLCLLLPAAEVALAVSSTTGAGTNAAFRYLLPSLPPLCIWAGQAWTIRSGIVARSACLCVLWLALDAVVAMPDYLAWQSELAWACSRDRPALIGDSLDWAQDLARLGDWVSKHSREGRTMVHAYGTGGGEAYGLGPPAAVASARSWDNVTYVAVSANILFGYQAHDCVRIGGQAEALTPGQRAILRNQVAFDRVGKSIMIYRAKDLPRSYTVR